MAYAEIGLTGCVAFAAAIVLTPVSIALARRSGVVAEPTPGAEAIHAEPAPRLGGLALAGAAGLAGTLAVCLSPARGDATTVSVAAMGAGATIMTIVGLLDDLGQCTWGWKLIIEIALASSVAAAGLRLGGPHPAVAFGIAVLWIVAVTNAVNFIDGIDGLAAGVSGIAALALVAIAVRAGGWQTALLAAALCGACLGFLVYNFYPSKTFMGDSGSLFVGFALAVLLLPLVHSPDRYSIVCAAIIALGLPIHDMLICTYRRWRHGQCMFTGDLGHFYNQLIDRLGFSQRSAALASYAVAALLGILAIGVARLPLSAALVATATISILMWGVATRLGFTGYAAVTATKGELHGAVGVPRRG